MGGVSFLWFFVFGVRLRNRLLRNADEVLGLEMRCCRDFQTSTSNRNLQNKSDQVKAIISGRRRLTNFHLASHQKKYHIVPSFFDVTF